MNSFPLQILELRYSAATFLLDSVVVKLNYKFDMAHLSLFDGGVSPDRSAPFYLCSFGSLPSGFFLESTQCLHNMRTSDGKVTELQA